MRRLALIVGATVIACSATAPVATSAGDADAGADAGLRSFDPRGYSTECVTKSDCVMAPIIQECSTCCGEVAVNKTEGAADLAAVEEACRQAGQRRRCGLDCAPLHAECTDGRCVACGNLTCDRGVIVHVTFSTPGNYVLSATFDGVTRSCPLLFPDQLAGSAERQCDPGLELRHRSLPMASTLDVDVVIDTTTAKTIVFRATRDGASIGEKTFEALYTTTPGPNGPQCEPKECVVATASFP